MGWLVLIGFLVVLGMGAYLTASRVFGQPRGLPRTLAAAVLGWAWATVGSQALGSLGLLNRSALLVLAASSLAVGWRRFAVMPESSPGPAKEAYTGKIAAFVAMSLTILAVFLIGTPSLLLPPKIVSDGPIYHLFFAAKWWKAGRIFLIASPFGENAATYFPANGDLWFATLMTLFGGDRPARIGQAPFLLLAGMSSFATARRLGAGPAAATIASAWCLTCFPLLLFSFEANVDTIFVAGYLASVYFGIRYSLGDDGAASLILAGLAAGLAWGTKPTATAFVPPLILLGALVILWGRLPVRAKLRHLALLGGSSLVGSGFWFARSLVLTGNPLYPLHLEAFGRVWLAGWYRSRDMRMSQFYLPVDDWRSLVSMMMTVFDPRLVPFWVAAWAGAWSWGRPRVPEARWIWILSAFSILNLAIYWLAIPYRTQQRFMLQAMGLAVPALALLVDRGAWLRWAGVLLLMMHLLSRQSWPFVAEGQRAFWELSETVPSVAPAPVQMALSPATWQQISLQPGGLAYLAVLLGIVIASFVLGWLWIRWMWGGGSRALQVATLASVCVVVAYVLLLDQVSGEPSKRVFPTFPQYQNAWTALERFSPPSGTNVAYAGTNLPLFLMGSGLRNDVRYVNVDEHRDWLMHDYHLNAAERGDPPVWPGPRPGWDRIHPNYEDWLENLRRDQIGLLVAAQANPADGAFNIADDERFTIERVWADAHPESFTLLYPREGADPSMRIYRVHPPKS